MSNYKKVIRGVFLICMLVFSGSVIAQKYTSNPGYFESDGIRLKYGFRPPYRDTVALSGKQDSIGTIVIKPQDSTMYRKGFAWWYPVGKSGASTLQQVTSLGDTTKNVIAYTGFDNIPNITGLTIGRGIMYSGSIFGGTREDLQLLTKTYTINATGGMQVISGNGFDISSSGSKGRLQADSIEFVSNTPEVGAKFNSWVSGYDARFANEFITKNQLDSLAAGAIDTTSLSNRINSKEPLISSGTTGQYWRGDKSWQTLNISAIPGLTDSLTNKTDSNSVKRLANIDTVSTIAFMQSYSGRAKLLFVSDVIRGGLFYLSTTGTADNGIVFSGSGGKRWIRSGINNNSVNVQWYGAIPNDGVDDYAAFLAAVLVRKDVYVPFGSFLIQTQCPLTANQRIYGTGPGSILYTTNNIAIIATGSGCTVENLYFLGTGKGTTEKYTTTNNLQYGVKIASSNLVTVNNCYFKFLGAAGIYLNISSSAVPYKGNAISNCIADSCFNGYLAGSFGEYTNFTNCKAFGCDYGVHIIGGNTGFVGCNINYNLTGVFVDSDRQNDAHGFVSDSKINHNIDYAVRVDSTLNSFLFSHNMMYFSNIKVKKTVYGVRFIGNDFSSMDSIILQDAVNVEFNENKFITKLPLFLKNWNGTDNTGNLSNVTFFNNKYVNGISAYPSATQPQNQLFSDVNIYNNSIHWGNATGAAGTAVDVFQRADGVRTGYIGDAASFDNKLWITALNGADVRFASQTGDASPLPILLNVLMANNGNVVLSDSVVDYSTGYVARVRVGQGKSFKADSIYGNIGTPLARFHFAGNTRLDLGSDTKWMLYQRDSTTGFLTGIPAGTTGQVLTAGFGGKPGWSGIQQGSDTSRVKYDKVKKAITANTTIDSTATKWLIDCTSTDVTITLPDATISPYWISTGTNVGYGIKYYILRTDNTAHVLTIQTSGGQKIDGQSTFSIYNNSYLNLFSDGANWYSN